MVEKTKNTLRKKVVIYTLAIACVTAFAAGGYFVPLDTFTIRGCVDPPNLNIRYDVILGGTAPFNQEKKSADSYTDTLPEVSDITGCFVPIVHRLYLL